MAISVVQHKGSNGGNVLSVALPFTSNVTSGDAILVGAYSGTNNNDTTLAVTDNVNGSVYGLDNTKGITNDGDTIRAWSLFGAGAGATTVTVSRGSTAGSLRVIIHEAAGLVSSAGLDQTNTGYNAGSTTGTTANVTTTSANELVIAYLGTAGNDTITATGSFTLLESSSTGGGLSSESQILSATTTLAASFGISPSDEYAAIISTYIGAGGGGGSTVHTLMAMGMGN